MDVPYCNVPLTYVDGPDRVGVDTAILDGRKANDDASLDERGFTLISHRSAVTDWSDGDELDRVHRPEMREVAGELTGADHVAVYPVLPRNPSAAQVEPDYAPIEFVHSDFTHDYLGMLSEPDRPYRRFLTPVLERFGLSQDQVDHASRVAVMQFWRNIGPVTADYPLALCDARDIGTDRLQPFVVPEYGSQRLEFETFAFDGPAAGQIDRWYTFPNLTVDEAIAFRTYDSELAEAGRHFWTPHSAFRDPHVELIPATRRASIEVRALCLWN